ncbi:hypothetical protein [Spirochaeta dissipatitropha]
MAKGRKRMLGLRVVILLCVALFLAGYTLGSFYPITDFDDSSFLGSMMRPGDNRHRR